MLRLSKASRPVWAILATALCALGLTPLLAATPAGAVSGCGSPDTTWTGASNVSWTDAGNWDNGVPTAGNDVCVPANMPNDPTISSGVAVSLNTLEVQIGATLIVNSGQLTLDTDSSISTLTLSGASGQVTTNGALDIPSNFNFNQGLIDGSGTITSEIGANIATTAAKTLSVGFINNGTLLWSNGDLAAGSQTITNNGTWHANTAAHTITAAVFNNAGTFTKSDASTDTLALTTFSNAGQLTLNGSSTLTVSATTFTNNGNVTITGATLNRGGQSFTQAGGRTYLGASGVINAANYNVTGGTAGGIGTINGAVGVSGGSLSPGGTLTVIGGIGTLNINGTLTQSAGTLQIEMQGTGSYDSVAVSGAVTLSGTATVQLIAKAVGYHPPDNSTYNALTYSSISGTYTTVSEDLNDNPSGYYLNDYGASPLTFTALYQGTFSGTVFTDTDGNGSQNGGETGRGGVTVYVDANHNSVFDGGEVNTSTDGSGNYTLSGLNVASYDVKAVVPGGYVQTTTALGPVAVASSQNVVGQSFGFFQTAAITGNVFTDTNSNGLVDGGEPASSGTTVYLDTNNNGVLDGGEISTTSDGSGNFSFSSLSASTYKVRVAFGSRTQTTTNPADVVVTSGTGASGIVFGLTPVTQSIAGTVYIDVNGNGTKDVGDTTGLSGATVFLDANHNGVVDGGEVTALTAGNGSYSFGGISSATYDVKVVPPTGYAQTSAALSAVVVGFNQAVIGQDLGLYQAPNITGMVYSDTNGDGIHQISETRGLPGVNVFFDTNNDGVRQGGEPEVTTNSSGVYTFSAVAGGTYKVRAVLPAGAISITTTNPADIVVTSGSGASGVEFGLNVVGSIAGTVYTDVNGNGTQNGGDTSLANITVFLDTNSNGILDAGELSTTTNGSGAYIFNGIDPNTYTVGVVTPPGYFQTSTPLSAVVVGNSQHVVAQLIGLYFGPVVSGSVYSDRNNNGTRDSDDVTGVPNVTVYLDVNGNSALDLTEPRVVTAPDGTYALPAVIAGTHFVRVVLPAAATQTSITPAAVVITSSNGASSIDFGLDVLGSISGTVYVDTNDNGTKDGGENTGAGAVTVFLDLNHDGTMNVGEPVTTTNGSGAYSFSAVAAGTYNVHVVPPTGWVLSSTPLSAVGVTTNQDVTGQNAGLFQPPDISGTVYVDTNNSGTKDTGETSGVAGVTVYFDTNNNSVLDGGETHVTTSVNGQYTFSTVAGGTYKVRVVLPSGASQNSANPADIVVTSGVGASNVNVGLDVLGSISGTVYADSNGNGTKGIGELGQAGVTVFLDANHNGVVDAGEISTVTVGGGAYVLAALPATTYDVRAVLPTGWVLSSTPLSAVIVTTNQDVPSANIGLFQPPDISGTVYVDTNNSGTKDTGETAGVAGATVYIDTNNNSVLDAGETQVTTDANGHYTFSSVPVGTYRVRVVLPGGATQTSANPADIVVTSGSGAANMNVGLDVLGSISGTVFTDVNGDGILNGGDPGSAGITVFLDANHNGIADPGELTTATNGVGIYSFTTLPAATFDVKAVLPSGWVQSSAALEAVVVATNADLAGQNIGVFQTGVVSGSVFFDVNGNGTADSNEPGIADVVVFLDTNSNGTLDEGELNTTTDASGNYTITGVGPGAYVTTILLTGTANRTRGPANGALNSGGTATGVGLGVDRPTLGPIDPVSEGTGYWLLGAGGKVYSFGDAPALGAPADLGTLGARTVGLAPTPSGVGYWVVASDGGVFSYGDAGFQGSAANIHLNAGVIAMAPTPTGKGYWLLASDGGVFSFGDANFFGSTGSMHLNSPVVGMTPTPTGLGYWLVAADGGVFSFGDANFFGSTGSMHLNSPVVGIASSPSGHGYWLVASDGGIFAFGDANFLGSAGNIKLKSPITNIRALSHGDGYWLIGADGGVFAFGDAQFLGSAGGTALPSPISD